MSAGNVLPATATQLLSSAHPRRSITLMGDMGDCEISWEESHDEAMQRLIKRLLDDGVTFFQVRKGIFRKRREKITDPNDIDSRLLIFDDKDFEKMFFNGDVELTRRGNGKLETTRILRDSAAIASTNTVATPRLGGG